jgi:hypothetical protein
VRTRRILAAARLADALVFATEWPLYRKLIAIGWLMR